jgi:predicted Fe-Mo cluster-binding NifX family protein
MRIAVTSQNHQAVTGHAGRCRKFLIFEVDGGYIQRRTPLELEESQTFHGDHQLPPPLEGIHALITGGMGEGLFNRLTTLGITPCITSETYPEAAVLAFAAGKLASEPPHSHGPGHAH